MVSENYYQNDQVTENQIRQMKEPAWGIAAKKKIEGYVCAVPPFGSVATENIHSDNIFGAPGGI